MENECHPALCQSDSRCAQPETRQRGLAHSASCLGSCYVAIPHPSDVVDTISSRVVMASNLVSRCASRDLPECRDLKEAPECGYTTVFPPSTCCEFDARVIVFSTEHFVGTAPTPSCAPTLAPVVGEETEPEATSPVCHPAESRCATTASIPLHHAYC